MGKIFQASLAPLNRVRLSLLLRLRWGHLCILAILFLVSVAPFEAVAQNAPPQSILDIATTLTRMGRQDVAQRLIRDYNTGRVRIGQIGANAETGVASAFGHYSGLGTNVMTLNRQYIEPYGAKAAGRVKAVNNTTLNAALTVIHEYVHMNQTSPEQTTRFEDSAWRATIEENQRWIRRIMSEITNTELHTPNSADKVARIKELTSTLNDLGQIHSATITGLNEEIQAGHVSAGLPLPTLSGSDAASPDQVRASVATSVSTFDRNTKDGLTRLEREIPNGVQDKPSAASKILAQADNKDQVGKTVEKKDDPNLPSKTSAASRLLAQVDNKNLAGKIEETKDQPSALDNKSDKDKTAADKSAKERAEKKKTARIKAEEERAEKIRQAREAQERAKAEQAARAKAERERAQAKKATEKQPSLPVGTHEEVSGWAKDKNGQAKLTYIKDANGQVLGGYTTYYDPSGKEVRREDFKSSPPAPSIPAGNSDGAYAGRFGGQGGEGGGTVRFTVKSGNVSGELVGANGWKASFSGTVNASGKMQANLSGKAGIVVREYGIDTYPITGSVSGTLTEGRATGTVSVEDSGKRQTTNWTASR